MSAQRTLWTSRCAHHGDAQFVMSHCLDSSMRIRCHDLVMIQNDIGGHSERLEAISSFRQVRHGFDGAWPMVCEGGRVLVMGGIECAKTGRYQIELGKQNEILGVIVLSLKETRSACRLGRSFLVLSALFGCTASDPSPATTYIRQCPLARRISSGSRDAAWTEERGTFSGENLIVNRWRTLSREYIGFFHFSSSSSASGIRVSHTAAEPILRRYRGPHLGTANARTTLEQLLVAVSMTLRGTFCDKSSNKASPLHSKKAVPSSQLVMCEAFSSVSELTQTRSRPRSLVGDHTSLAATAWPQSQIESRV